MPGSMPTNSVSKPDLLQPMMLSSTCEVWSTMHVSTGWSREAALLRRGFSFPSTFATRVPFERGLQIGSGGFLTLHVMIVLFDKSERPSKKQCWKPRKSEMQSSKIATYFSISISNYVSPEQASRATSYIKHLNTRSMPMFQIEKYRPTFVR